MSAPFELLELWSGKVANSNLEHGSACSGGFQPRDSIGDGYPVSPVRKQVVTWFGLTFELMLAGMASIVVYTVRHLPTR